MVVNQRHIHKTHRIRTFWLETERRFPKSSVVQGSHAQRPYVQSEQVSVENPPIIRERGRPEAVAAQEAVAT